MRAVLNDQRTVNKTNGEDTSIYLSMRGVTSPAPLRSWAPGGGGFT